MVPVQQRCARDAGGEQLEVVHGDQPVRVFLLDGFALFGGIDIASEAPDMDREVAAADIVTEAAAPAPA